MHEITRFAKRQVTELLGTSCYTWTVYCTVQLMTLLIGVIAGFVEGLLDGRCYVAILSTAFIYCYNKGSCLWTYNMANSDHNMNLALSEFSA